MIINSCPSKLIEMLNFEEPLAWCVVATWTNEEATQTSETKHGFNIQSFEQMYIKGCSNIMSTTQQGGEGMGGRLVNADIGWQRREGGLKNADLSWQGNDKSRKKGEIISFY